MSVAVTNEILHGTLLFCSSLFMLQKMWYRQLQGTESTISCAFCPYSPKLLTRTRSLLKVKPCKVAGPDNSPGWVLTDCAFQLSEVLTDIFNISLFQAKVPSCFKSATIIPVPKTSTVSCLNDYRPVALTPILMKCFEWWVMDQINKGIDFSIDPQQYACKRNRCTADAISYVVHMALTHLKNRHCYARLLFLDFSSAFNTIIPQTLVHMLEALGLSPALCHWVLDFLTNRRQTVGIHNITFSRIILNTGSPQGCVLSPLLYSLLIYDGSATFSSNHVVKFAVDTAVVGCRANLLQRWD